MHFDLTDLRLFLLVVEAGSITAGAARAGLSLASASTRVRGMEQQCGTALLERSRQGVQPTAAGSALLHHARLVTRQMERMRGDLGAFTRGLRARVRLLANTAACAGFLPEPLARFLATHPQVDVDMEERPSAAVVQGVREGQAELGIAADHADFVGLEVRPFRLDRLVLVVPAGDALAAHGSIGFAEVLGRDMIGLGRGVALQQHLDHQAARLGGRICLRARAGSMEDACRMVALGAGLAVVPAILVRTGHVGEGLAVLRLIDPWAERRLYLVTRTLAHLPAHARRLAEALTGVQP